MVLASTPSGRETGHTGHFWSHLWGGLGAARGGEKGLQTFCRGMNGIFTLERLANGRVVFQGNAGASGKRKNYDNTGSRLLQLCIPRRKLYLTGRMTPREAHLTQERIDEVLAAGRIKCGAVSSGELQLPAILELLKDPLPPTRCMAAGLLERRNINCVDKLIPMLESDNRFARYGAAEALGKAGFNSKQAVDALLRALSEDKDLVFQSYAIKAMTVPDENKGLLLAAKPAIPVLLKMAAEPSPDDPRRAMQQILSRTLCYDRRGGSGRGLIHKYGLGGVDRAVLLPALKSIMRNENNAARGEVRNILGRLSAEDRDQLWGPLYRAVLMRGHSNIMFASVMVPGQIRAGEGKPLKVYILAGQSNMEGPPRTCLIKLGKNVLPRLRPYLKDEERANGVDSR